MYHFTLRLINSSRTAPLHLPPRAFYADQKEGWKGGRKGGRVEGRLEGRVEGWKEGWKGLRGGEPKGWMGGGTRYLVRIRELVG